MRRPIAERASAVRPGASRLLWRASWLVALLTLPGVVLAHSFGRTYTLPVPLWLYTYGAAAALILSFLMAGWLTRHAARWQDDGAPAPAAWHDSGEEAPAGPWLRRWRWLSLAGLGLAVVTGLLGSRNPYANFSMTWFWVIFVLGATYLSALIGQGNARANPWHVMGVLLASWRPRWRTGLWRYPARLGYWPALALYMGFIWVELFAHVVPFTLAWLLIGYTVFTLLAMRAFGVRDWLRQGEFFSVFLRLIGLMACRCWQAAEGGAGRWQWRMPFSGLPGRRCEDVSLLVFLLFMLSSTSFDGLHETAPWVALFWRDGLELMRPWLAPPLVSHYPLLLDLYLLWQTLALVLSPFIYLLLYLFTIRLMRALTGSELSVRELALRFAFTLLPIVLVYHVSHYYTLLVTQGTQLLPLLSDPFGRGWNLFGTATWLRRPIIPEAGTVWHAQVGLIVLGHVISVWLAHVEALRLFGSARMALRSQWPMLVLMVVFTTSGLWILSQPFSPGISLQGLSSN